jgi:hypothetical protein
MRITLRRKRSCLFALLALAAVVLVSIWPAASAKSDLELRFNQIKIGITYPEVMAVIEADRMVEVSHEQVVDGQHSLITRCGWANAGEQINPTFEGDRLTGKEIHFARCPQADSPTLGSLH